MKMETVNKEWVKECSRDLGNYPLVIPNEIPENFSISGHPEYFLGKPFSERVKIEISSYRGISIGAIHYYATISVSQPQICKRDENGKVLVCGGYICEEWRNTPSELSDNIGGRWVIEAMRHLTRKEIDDDPERWVGYDEGDTTSSFETKEEARDVALKIARFRFPDREIEIEELI